MRPLIADDTEIFLGGAFEGQFARPNVLFIMDTSTNMGSNVPTLGVWGGENKIGLVARYSH